MQNGKVIAYERLKFEVFIPPTHVTAKTAALKIQPSLRD